MLGEVCLTAELCVFELECLDCREVSVENDTMMLHDEQDHTTTQSETVDHAFFKNITRLFEPTVY